MSYYGYDMKSEVARCQVANGSYPSFLNKKHNMQNKRRKMFLVKCAKCLW